MQPHRHNCTPKKSHKRTAILGHTGETKKAYKVTWKRSISYSCLHNQILAEVQSTNNDNAVRLAMAPWNMCAHYTVCTRRQTRWAKRHMRQIERQTFNTNYAHTHTRTHVSNSHARMRAKEPIFTHSAQKNVMETFIS